MVFFWSFNLTFVRYSVMNTWATVTKASIHVKSRTVRQKNQRNFRAKYATKCTKVINEVTQRVSLLNGLQFDFVLALFRGIFYAFIYRTFGKEVNGCSLIFQSTSLQNGNSELGKFVQYLQSSGTKWTWKRMVNLPRLSAFSRMRSVSFFKKSLLRHDATWLNWTFSSFREFRL